MGTSLYIIIYRLRGWGDFERNHMVNFVEKVVVIHRGEKRKIVSHVVMCDVDRDVSSAYC